MSLVDQLLADPQLAELAARVSEHYGWNMGSFSDEEDEIFDDDPEEERDLGYKPQKELIFNKYLPYDVDIDEEAEEYLARIKGSLSKTIAMSEIRPGTVTFMSRLSKYMKLYGMRFSKEDHVLFVKTFYELVVMPDLEFSVQLKAANMLSSLLRKKELLTRDDLELDWWPLYRTFEATFVTPFDKDKIINRPRGLRNALKSAIRRSSVYFSVSATEEILAEFRPRLCPFDSAMNLGVEYLSTFLPVNLPPEHHDRGFKLWFNEMMDMYCVCTNRIGFEPEMLFLLSRTAEHNIGYIDWSPYYPVFFTKLLQFFELPISYQGMRASLGSTVHLSSMVGILVVCLGGENSCQSHLDILFEALDSFFNPANVGKFTKNLSDFLLLLVDSFIRRIHKERYRKRQMWDWSVPEHLKLTDEDIERFVKCVLPASMLCIGSGRTLKSSVEVLQMLAFIRPDMVLPKLVEKMYHALDTLTEPHRLTSAMHCLSLCSRPMAAGARYGKPGEPVYDEGPGHILPILMKSLPGIDPNDSRKTFVTFELISFYSQLILFVDCSSAPDHYEDLTEKEHALCMETACCEDFVLEFLDRCFHFIESCSSLAECNTQAIDAGDPLAVAMSVEEQCADSALNSVCSSILSHTSSSILASALRKMQSHILGRTMETRVSGKYATSMLKGALKADPKMTLKAFVPGLIRTVKSLTESDDFLGKEHGDSELLYNLLLLAELTKVQDSDAIMPYVEDLADIIDRCLMMKSREGHDLVASIAGGVIWSLIQVSPMEYRSVPFSLDEPVSKRLYIRHWADSGVPWNLDVKWNLPTAEHLELGEKLFRRFLGPIVDELQKFAKKEIFLEREPLEQRLVILEEIVCSVTWGLPLWTDEEPIYTLQSCVPLNPMRVASYPKDYRFMTFEGGKNVRAVLLELMHDLVERLVGSQEEETQTLSAISSIILSLFSDYGLARGAQNNHVKQWQVQRRAQEDKLGRTGRHLRPSLINRVQLQHEERCAARVPWPLMPRHRTALKDLFKLSTSRYDAVRIGAQDELLYLLRSYPSSYVFVFEEMLEIMQMDPTENHEKFKGALYLLCAKPGSLAIKQDWEVIRKLWPILVKCKPSEKPSILGLIDRTARVVQENLEMFQIHLKISPAVTQFAEQLWTCVATGQKQPSSYLTYPTAEEKEKGALALKEKGEKNEKLYMEVLTDLGNALQGVNDAQLHWRRAAVAFAMVSSALRPDVEIPMAIVRAGLQHLTNDHLLVRKHALYITCCILRLQKRARMYVDIDPVTLQIKSEPKLRAVPGVPVPTITPPKGLHPLVAGDRPDNEWLQYDASRWHDTKEKYDQPHVHKTFYGWYCWPTVMQVHAPSSAQPKANRTPEEMPETERAVFEFLSDKQRWEQLMGFFCLEENKGHDKFDSRRFVFFKYLTRNFGKSMTDVFTPYLQDLAVDAQESRQRVAAEMIAGMAIGMKHWPFEEAKALQDYVVPLLTKGLSAVTPETMNDWAVGVSTVMADKDPNRYYWLLEALADNPIRDDGAFVESTRCYALQSAFTQEEWRIGKMMHRFVEYFMPHMSHPFQNIRERVASVVASLIIMDIPLKGYNNAHNPSRKAIFARLTEGLAPLLAGGCCSPSASSTSLQPADVDANGVVGDVAMTEHSAVDGLEPMDCDDAGGECVKKEGLATSASTSTGSDDVEKAKRLLESVSRVILGCVNRAFFTSPPEFHELLPLLANMENQDHEVDLKRCCKNCLNLLARAPVLSEDMPSILEHLGKTLTAESWKTRASGMSFLQVFCFHNMFVLRLKPEWLDTVYNFVYTGLRDARIEVRVRSSEVLGGLLHCRILTEDEQVDLRSQLLKRIRAMSKKAGRRARGLLKKDTTADDAEEDRKRIVECHSVILGLCAFVNAYPYDVPEYIPEFLMILGEHLHDPEPIPSTIKKTLSEFKRTHLDNWQEHKLKFSEDQLVMLTDLLVSPSYYA